MSKQLFATLKGMGYRITPATMLKIQELCPLKVELRRDPENDHDENAIAVYCMERPWRDTHFGYIDRAVAAEFAPRMDAGKIHVIEAWLDEIDEQGVGPVRIKFERAKAKS